ncbi:MAG: glutathione synthase [Candidatus Binataceae bacterium]
MAYKFAFVMDPLGGINIEKDTTFVFMLEALRRGHEIFFIGLRDLFVHEGRAMGTARRCEVMRAETHYRFLDSSGHGLALDSFDAIFMRKDPPADDAYLYGTMILSLVDPRRSFILNSPAGLREANEKLYTLNFPEVIPPTIVTSHIAHLRQFMREMNGDIIVKPLDGHGGEGVFLASRTDRNLSAILETVTRFETRLMMGQRYIPEIRQGDKRIIVLNGEPLGATLRVPAPEENRGNIHAGGECVKAELTERDLKICGALRPRLLRDGMYFVGLDVIGDYLTEINVTSPTGVQEIDRLDGVKLEANVIDFVEARVAALRA